MPMSLYLSAFLASPMALAGRIPVEDARCDLAALSITEAGGTTYDPARGLAVVDHNDDRVRFVTADCVATATFSTAGYATNPRGIAWSEQLQEFAIVDPGTDELYYVSPAGARTGSCDLATIGSTGASGVAWDPFTQRYVVSDDATSHIYYVDPTVRAGGTCARVSDFSTASLGLNTPVEVAVDGDGNVVFSRGNSGAALYVVTPAGTLVEEIALNVDIQNIQGIVPDPALPDRFYLLDTESDDDLIHVDVRGTSTSVCSILGGGSPRGLAYIESTNQFLVAESGVDAIQVFNAATCVMQRTIDLQALGVTSASDVAFLPVSNEIVVTDEGTDDLFFVDATRGTLNSRCDLSPLGLAIPRGLVALPDLDLVAVSAYHHRAWAVLDPSCAVAHARPLAYLSGEQATVPSAEAIGWLPSAGVFLHSANAMIFVSSFEGTPGFRFDTPGANATGLASDPSDPTAFWYQSYGNIERVVLPRLVEDPSISGRFASATAAVYLWDRGEGR